MQMFDGATFDEGRDGARLNRQLTDVKRLMSDERWRTLGEIARELDHPQASISARLRDLRKSKFGGYTVLREYVCDGLWRYRLLVKDHVENKA